MTKLTTFRMVAVGTAAALAFLVAASAQDTAKLQEPEYANSFFLLDAGGSLKPLERAPMGVSGKARVLVFGQTGVSYEIQNEHSPVRVEAGAPLAIVVKPENHDVDPATLVLLYSLKAQKGKRQLLISGLGTLSIHTKSDLQNKQLQMVFARYGEASLKITPAIPLAPGEYAITLLNRDQQPTAYCFGVDAGGK